MAAISWPVSMASRPKKPLWGVRMTLSMSLRGLSGSIGSVSSTSRAAPPISPARRASIRSGSRTRPPRATLTRRAPGFIFRKASRLKTCRVAGISGAWMDSTSDSRSSVSKSTSSAPLSAASSRLTQGSQTMQRL